MIPSGSKSNPKRLEKPVPAKKSQYGSKPVRLEREAIKPAQALKTKPGELATGKPVFP